MLFYILQKENISVNIAYFLSEIYYQTKFQDHKLGGSSVASTLDVHTAPYWC
jgi:hypothetical protein